MSNPTTGTWGLGASLEGSPAPLIGSAPIRFTSGLWLEQATTNYFYDPDHRNSASWVVSGGTVTHNNVPGDYYHEITASANDQGARTANAYVANPMPGIAGAWTFATDILLVSGDDRWSIRAFEFSSGGSVLVSNALVAALNITGNWIRYVGTYTPSNPSTAFVSFSVRRSQGGGSGGVARVRRTAIEQGGIATSQCPEFDSGGTILSGYAFTGTAHASTSTRAASSASITISEPAAVACWYREGYSGAKQFAYLDTLGQLGDYGDVSWAAGDLTISTSRNLVIGPFAAFDRALTATEQANLRSTQNWSMNSVNGSNIILPLSGRRRPR